MTELIDFPRSSKETYQVSFIRKLILVLTFKNTYVQIERKIFKIKFSQVVLAFGTNFKLRSKKTGHIVFPMD